MRRGIYYTTLFAFCNKKRKIIQIIYTIPQHLVVYVPSLNCLDFPQIG